MLSTFDTSVNLNRNAGGIVCTHCSVEGEGAAEEVEAVLLHPRAACVSATCPLSGSRAVWTHNGTGVSVVHSSQ